ncbi:MAG: hypothetical protein JRH11_02480 [Deltaproteobacteria bacterium]|nr:hypothetical protein [Deltaproteobacteria bacterium]
MTTMPRFLLLNLLALAMLTLPALACSDDTGGTDSSTPTDTGTGADTGAATDTGTDTGTATDTGTGTDTGTATDTGTPTDAGTTTPCGDGTCDRATEVCIEGAFGGPTTIGCQAVPSGCETDRTCTCLAATYCNTGLAMCTDTSDNHIFCDTGLD